MTSAEWPRIKRLLKAGWVERDSDRIDEAAMAKLLKPFSLGEIETAIQQLLGSDWMPKASEIVAAMPEEIRDAELDAPDWLTPSLKRVLLRMRHERPTLFKGIMGDVARQHGHEFVERHFRVRSSVPFGDETAAEIGVR